MGRDVDVPRLLERLGIVAKRQGHEWWACCPLPDHDERTPSWQMRDEPGERHGFWSCHGCSRGGGPVGLVRQVLGLEDTRAASEWLWSDAAAHRLQPLRVELDMRPRSHGFEMPASVVFAPLAEWISPARAYLESRGVTAAQVERWGIGYAVDGRLAGRVVFPVRDGAGRLLSYTGRTFVGSRKKYFEPTTDEGADKGAVFGELHWPPPAARRGHTLVVGEGAIDALAIERAVGGYVAAVYGSATLETVTGWISPTPQHLARLATFDELIVASDPDDAGERFARSLVEALGRWVRVRRVSFPDGYDAAGLEQERGSAALAEVLGCPIVRPPSATCSGSTQVRRRRSCVKR